MHEYATSFGLPEIDKEITFYLYHDVEGLIPVFEAVTGMNAERDRNWSSGAVAEVWKGSVFVTTSAFQNLMDVIAHEVSHAQRAAISGFEMSGGTHEVQSYGPTWLEEGVAYLHANLAMDLGGFLSWDGLRSRTVPDKSNFPPLDRLETREQTWAVQAGDWYGKWAAELLASFAGEGALFRYHILLQPGTTWQEAFQEAFGMTINEFYVLFEAHSEAGFPKVELSTNRVGESLFQLSDLRGSPVVLHSWSPGCEPCRSDILAKKSAYDSGEWAGVEFVAIQVRGSPERGQAIAAELGLSYRLVFDPGGEVSRDFGLTEDPTTIFLDSDHSVAGKWIGVLDHELLNTTLSITLGPDISDPSDSQQCGFSGLPDRFFTESSVSREQVERVVSAQYLSLKKMHNGITPYDFCVVEYNPGAYGHTTPYGLKLGNSAFPGLNSGHHRWEVMAHEQGHNFFGATKPFYYDIATPAPFLQESLAVLSAFYTFHDLLENQQEYGIDDATVESLVFDFGNGRAYQEAQSKEYVDQGMKFDIHDILTSQALDFMMITYGEEYGWDKFERLTKAFEEFGVQLNHDSEGVTPLDQSTYIVAALTVAFDQDFRQDFLDLSFPIDDARYQYFYAQVSEHLGPL